MYEVGLYNAVCLYNIYLREGVKPNADEMARLAKPGPKMDCVGCPLSLVSFL